MTKAYPSLSGSDTICSHSSHYATALEFWYKLALSRVRGEDPDLTMRQFSILLSVSLEPPPHTVRGLANLLGVTKPVISRALDTMGQMGLVQRRRDERDRRNVLIQTTEAGEAFLKRFDAVITQQLSEFASNENG